MTFEIIKDKGIWDNFVDRSPYGLLFHKWNFLKTIEKHSNFKLFTYGIFNKSNLIVIFPFFYNKTIGIKTIFSPPPKAAIPSLGFLMNEEYSIHKQSKKESILDITIKDINIVIKGLSPNYILLYTVPNFLDVRPFKWIGFSVEPLYTYTINVVKSLDEIYGGFKQTVRYDIKKAKKLKLKIEQNDNISIFYDMQKDRYKEQGLNIPFLSKKYIEELFRHFPDNLRIYYLHDENDNIISFTVTQEYKDRYISWLGPPKSLNYVNEYFTWWLIQNAKLKNYRIFDFEGANTKRICNFKGKFNPDLELYFQLEKSKLSGTIVKNLYLQLRK